MPDTPFNKVIFPINPHGNIFLTDISVTFAVYSNCINAVTAIEINVATAGPVKPIVKYPTQFNITFNSKLNKDETKINYVLPSAYKIITK